jgi:hypothetical protein
MRLIASEIRERENLAMTFWWQVCCTTTRASGVAETNGLGLLPQGVCSGRRNVACNSKSTTLYEILWYRIRSFSWNRNVSRAGFRSWCVQWKSWSNTKSCTERYVGRQTPLHNLTYRPRTGRNQSRPETGMLTPHRPTRSCAESAGQDCDGP